MKQGITVLALESNSEKWKLKTKLKIKDINKWASQETNKGKKIKKNRFRIVLTNWPSSKVRPQNLFTREWVKKI